VVEKSSLEAAFSMKEPVIGLRFASEDLTDFITSESKFADCRFNDCVFDGAKIRECEFIGCSFSNCSFKEAEFFNCIFVDRETQAGSAWNYCDLNEAKFKACNLSNNRIVKCEAFLLEITDSSAVGLQFDAEVHRKISKRMMFGGVVLQRCKLQYAVFAASSYEESRFESCDLRDCSFVESNLSRVSLMGSSLNNIDFTGATLDFANLSQATFDEMDLAAMASFKGMTVSRDQHENLLRSMGILTSG